MPTIAPPDRETALRLRRAGEPLSPPDDAINFRTLPQRFEVSQALFDAYEADLANPAPPLPNCRANNPCYSSQCAEPVPPITAAPTLTLINPMNAGLGQPDTTFTLTGTNFVAPLTVSVDYPGAGGANLTGTVTSPTSATVLIPAAGFAAAGEGLINVSTANGVSSQLPYTVA